MLPEELTGGRPLGADGSKAGAAVENRVEKPRGDGPKTGEVLERAQKIADAMVAKKLKGMPSKEEVSEWRAWKEGRDAQDKEAAQKLKAAGEAEKTAEKLQREAAAKIAAAGAGIRPEFVDDAVTLALARPEEDKSIADVMGGIAKKNRQWLRPDVNMPGGGANPLAAGAPKTTLYGAVREYLLKN